VRRFKADDEWFVIHCVKLAKHYEKQKRKNRKSGQDHLREKSDAINENTVVSGSIGHSISELGNCKDNGECTDKMLEDGFDLLVLLSQDNMTKSDVREHPAEAKKKKTRARMHALGQAVGLGGRCPC